MLVGQSLANNTQGVPGTWKWTGYRWSLLSRTSPAAADTAGYDPVSHRLLAYGAQAPFTPGSGMGAPSSPGYCRTWAFNGRRWSELGPVTTPDRAPGVLTASPDGRRLLLINTRSHTWVWTSRDWQLHDPGWPRYRPRIMDRCRSELTATTSAHADERALRVLYGEPRGMADRDSSGSLARAATERSPDVSSCARLGS